MSSNVAAESGTRPNLRKIIAAATVGNFVEWYEFAIYGLVAAYISRSFFPTDDPTAAMLSTWAAFGTAFLVRPLGGILLARIGDRHGRRAILSISIVLMSAATFVIGLVPSYTTIGIAAPVLLITLRLVQGLAAGGELAGAVAFLYEHAAPAKRARTVSWLTAGTFVSALVGSLFATVLTATLPADAMQSWGWRILFLISLPLGFVGLYIRRRVEETPAFTAMREAQAEGGSAPVHTPFWSTMRAHKRSVFVYIGFGALYSTGSYITLSAYLAFMAANGMPMGSALLINTLLCVAVVLAILATGGLSDRFGRRPVLLTGAAVLLVTVVPAFLLGASGSFGLALLGGLLFVVPFALYATPAYVGIVEQFPAAIRVTAGAVAYNVCVILGGFAPFISAWLAASTRSTIAFPVYVCVLAVLAVGTLAFAFREPAREQA